MKKIFTLRFGTTEYWGTMQTIEDLKKTYGDDVEINILRNGQDVNIIINVKDEKKVKFEDVMAIGYLL